MRYYYNPSTDQYAKVLGEDAHSNFVTVVIDDKKQVMDWDEFVGQFNQLVDVYEDKSAEVSR